MISQLKGTVDRIDGSVVTVDVGGVGYQVSCSVNGVAELALGAPAVLIIHTEVREDAINLYGFLDPMERQLFLLLIQVNGIGAKSALEILSQVDCRQLIQVIGKGDVARLQQVRGIGKKTADRIVVELKDKLADQAFVTLGGHRLSAVSKELNGAVVEDPHADALEALIALGFTRKDAERAVAQVPDGRSTPSQIVKEALRFV